MRPRRAPRQRCHLLAACRSRLNRWIRAAIWRVTCLTDASPGSLVSHGTVGLRACRPRRMERDLRQSCREAGEDDPGPCRCSSSRSPPRPGVHAANRSGWMAVVCLANGDAVHTQAQRGYPAHEYPPAIVRAVVAFRAAWRSGLPHPAVHVAPGRQALVRRDVGVRRRRADPRRRRPALLVLPVRARVDRALRLRGNASLGGKAGLYEYR